MTLPLRIAMGLAASLLTIAAACADDPVGPELEVRTPLVAFGTVRCGTTATRTVTVANPGDEPLQLTAKSSIESVTVAPVSATVEPGSSVELTVSAKAIPIGANPLPTQGDVTVSANLANGQVRIPVTFDAAGISTSVSPIEVNFGSVRSGQTGFGVVAVAAQGVGSASFGVELLSGLEFELESTRHFQLAAGQVAQLSLRFRPFGAPGPVTGAMSIEGTGELCSPKSTAIALRGTVLAP